MRLKSIINIMIFLILLAACQKPTTSPDTATIIELPIIGLAALEIGCPTADTISDQAPQVVERHWPRVCRLQP